MGRFFPDLDGPIEGLQRKLGSGAKMDTAFYIHYGLTEVRGPEVGAKKPPNSNAR